VSISKIVITGTVVRNPEKRFTNNNVPITHFTINISKSEEASLVRVITAGKLAESTADSVKKDSVVIVEGRLQNNVVKNETGTEQKIVEISAQAVEVVGETTNKSDYQESTGSFNDSEEISTDELIGEDEIPF
jgi:single-strand DNA-binding protein